MKPQLTAPIALVVGPAAGMTPLRKAIGALGVAGIALTVVLVSAPTASVAESTFSFDWSVDASTHLAQLNETVVAPRGSFTGTVDLVTGRVRGNITLPPATSTITLAGVGLATATFQITEVAPVTGHVDFTTFQATATSVFDLRLVRASLVSRPFVNLVGRSCTTSTPVKVTISGTASLTTASTFGGTYTIPPLKHCGFATPALNLVAPGPGNTFTVVVGPRT